MSIANYSIDIKYVRIVSLQNKISQITVIRLWNRNQKVPLHYSYIYFSERSHSRKHSSSVVCEKDNPLSSRQDATIRFDGRTDIRLIKQEGQLRKQIARQHWSIL